CRTRVQVGGGDEATCSCDCIEGTTGACPDSMVCSNAYCTYRRGRIVCEPVDSQFQANEMPKCFPKTRSQVSCTSHDDCSYGLFCIDGACGVDTEGCDTCSECVRQSDCAEGSNCVNTQRGRRCLHPCENDDLCDVGTHCVPLPTVGRRYCINDDSDRKGVCPRSWKCPLADRCLLDSDCDDDCSCVDNACACESETVDMSLTPDAQTTPPIEFADSEQGKTNSGCALNTGTPNSWVLSLMFVVGLCRKRRREA
ncbi:MAG: hypothetical protein ACPGQS_08560, partial [Bradymonadia bacterium]